jgi:conjugative relaxase-like TrwC/TraI family protein
VCRCPAGDDVISIGRLGVGAQGYYLDAVARGTEEYYSVRGEVRGRWVGAGTPALGLTGAVAGEDLGAVLAGLDPSNGDRLASSARKVPGFDVTFSAPKSVSLLFALSDPAVSAQVIGAHETAVETTLSYLEDAACRTRRGHAGTERLRAEGFIGAAFRHRTSRAGDPQLHTHVLVANLVRGTDGAWGTLDSRGLYRGARTGGYLYQAVLRHELTQRLGVAFGPVVKGCAELEGIAQPVLRAFSRRRVEIEIALDVHGSSGRDAAQIAALATRQPKDHDTDAVSLRQEWDQRAETLGLHPGRVRLLVNRATARESPAPDHRLLAAVLTEEQSTFDDPAVLRALAEHARPGATIDQLRRQARGFLTDLQVLRVAPGLYTTREMVQLEHSVVASAQARVNAGTAVVPISTVEQIIAASGSLSREQAAMVGALTSLGHGVDVVVGVAGAGKTQALAAARRAWTATGYDVRGAALAARTAAELQARAQIPATSLDALLGALDRTETSLSARTVVVLDEAGMVGTRKLARLLTHAERAHAKVVLVGDDHQLPEIQAGGAFHGLVDRLPSVELTQNRRQQDPIERCALAELRAGRGDRALEHLTARGHITMAATRHDAQTEMINRWVAAHRDGDDVIMLASRRRDVHHLNHHARAALLAAHQLPPSSLEVRGHQFAVGDRVMTLQNWRRHGIINGERGVITAITGETVAMHFDTGRDMTLPPSYLRAGHLTHAYAMTIHKAQGLTADRCLVLADDTLSPEAAYTAMSRGRFENQLVVVNSDEPHRDIGHGPVARAPDPIERLSATLRASRAKTMAIDTPGSMPVLAPFRPPAPGIGLER